MFSSVALNKNCALEVYGVYAVYHLGFSSKQFQSCNKSLIHQACSGPSWENIGPWSFLYGSLCARSVLSRPRAEILPVRPSCLVDKIYILAKFFFCVFMDRDEVELHKLTKKGGQYPVILTEQTWSIKDLLYGFRGNFSCGIQRMVPSGQDGSILPPRVANHIARFGSS